MAILNEVVFLVCFLGVFFKRMGGGKSKDMLMQNKQSILRTASKKAHTQLL